MRTPLLIKLFIRNEKDDRQFRGKPGVHHTLVSKAAGAFGMVRSQSQQAHQGWDLYAPVNSPVVAIADGVVVSVGHHTGYGRAVILRFAFHGHPDGLYALYGHLCQTSVMEGEVVKEGAVLGYTGTDGNAHGQPPHLHFEVRTINPCPYYKKDPLRHRISPGIVLAGHYGL